MSPSDSRPPGDRIHPRRRPRAATSFRSGSFGDPPLSHTVLEEVGALYSRVAPDDPYVIVDDRLVTGQNQQSASEYALALLHEMTVEARSSAA